MKETEYQLSDGRFGRELLFALVSDLHGENPEAVLRALSRKKPNYILMPGDIFERLDGVDDETHRHALALLRGASQLAPTFYVTGNHEDGGCHSWNPFWRVAVKERTYSPEDVRAIEQSGAIFLRDSFVLRDGIAFGGLLSGLISEGQRPNTAWLEEFFAVDAPHVLLCHHPEYYEKYLKRFSPELVVSGHAHGGQWRFFGQGVFAPGQGLFPKYTAGVHDGRLVISTGLKKGKWCLPRFFNEPELVWIRIGSK